MTTVILCGGLGTRLRSVIDDRPKVLAPIADTPFLAYLLAHLSRQGLTDVVLSTGYLGNMVQAFAGDGSPWQVHLRYIQEPEPLGTGGALRYVADHLGLPPTFLVLNGDTFFSGTLPHLASFHQAQEDAVGTMALVKVPRADRYGAVQTNRLHAVSAFTEKNPASTGPAWINAGAYVIDKKLIEGLSPLSYASLERDIFPQWIDKGLYGYPYADAVFLDIGTPEDYARAPTILQAPQRFHNPKPSPL